MTWTRNGAVYSLTLDNSLAATIQPRLGEFLLILLLPNGKTIYKFGESVQKLMDHAEAELKVTA